MKNLDLHQIAGKRARALDESKDEPNLSICLITALSVIDFIDPELSSRGQTNTGANMGILTLAAILREAGFKPHIVNLDSLFISFIEGEGRPTAELEEQAIPASAVNGGRADFSAPGQSNRFFPFVVKHLKSLSFDVFGFSSICGSFPLTLRLAREVKRLNPNARIILGGPQASVVDVATMSAFPFVDFIVRGEADETFPALLKALSHTIAGEWENIPGITFRRGNNVIRNKNAPAIENLDRLPLPAIDLDPDLKGRGGIHLEVGRGCPFACTFCSTNDFFRRNFRLKSAEEMIREMKLIKKEYGISYFSLIHDMYTVDRKKVVAFCEALLECGEEFTWGCSARTDCIDDELIGLMAKAGCRGIFFGIETGSPRMQYVVNKRLDLVEAMERIRCADGHGIKMAVALIIGFPEETRDDLRDTVHFFIDSLRFDNAEPQVSLLAPLAGTPIYEEYKDRLFFDHIYSSMSHQGWRQDPVEVEMIKDYPDIFPNFYAIPTMWLDRGYLKEVLDFMMYTASWFRWLPVALVQDSGDFLEVFDRWRSWVAERSPAASDDGMRWAPYYCQRLFHKEFVEFIRTCYLEEMATSRAVIKALTEIEGLSYTLTPASLAVEICDYLDEDCVPYPAANLYLSDIEVDYKELIESLRNKSDLSRVSERKTTIVFTPTNDKKVNVWQLAPLSARLLRLCDGRRTVNEIAQEFSLQDAGIDGIAPEKACIFGLLKLQKDGFIGFSTGPIATESEASEIDEELTTTPEFAMLPQGTNTQQPWPPQNVGESPSRIV